MTFEVLQLRVETICEMSGSVNELRYEAHDHSNELKTKLETSAPLNLNMKSAESIKNDVRS